jgi:hypothetical protein
LLQTGKTDVVKEPKKGGNKEWKGIRQERINCGGGTTGYNHKERTLQLHQQQKAT